jgi:3-oxoacyl-[acyl-carrier protein] reductase
MNERRIAVVTGAASGLGLAMAKTLHASGFQVLLLDVSPHVHEVAAQMSDGAEAVALDLNQTDSLDAFRDHLSSKYGRCDVLVNNAGIHPKEADGAKLSVERLSLEVWETTLSVNLTAPFMLSKLLLPLMQERRWGRIVNVSSRGGRTHIPGCGAHYATTKAALIGFTRVLAEEGAPFGVTANVIAPGRIDTPMSNRTTVANMERSLRAIPLKRAGTPDEVAGAVDFLVSEAASYVTGAVVDINGGSFMP